MLIRHTNRRSAMHGAAGFTLIEMLVSVGLVMLMMSLFAAVFVESTKSLSKQRGIAENDQRGRMLTTVLRNDLDGRTFRDVLPFRANEITSASPYLDSRRAGYFEYYEGDPTNQTDDVLQFTTSVNLQLVGTDAPPFVGRAATLSGSASMSQVPIASATASSITIAGDYTTLVAPSSYIWILGSTNGTNDGRYLVGPIQSGLSASVQFSSGNTTIAVTTSIPNASLAQLGNVYLSENDPDFDDGVFGNGASVASNAEVSYFLRNGVLYRRVLLIRGAQPTWSTGAPMLWNTAVSNSNYPTTVNATSTSFWRDFDFSAFYFAGKIPFGAGPVISPGVYFHSADASLNNSDQGARLVYDETSLTSLKSYPLSLGFPAFRFGHNVSSGTTFGYPQQVSTANAVSRFILMECSNTDFGYPGYVSANGNPYNRTNLTIDPASGYVQQYWGPTAPAANETFRRGEDSLLSNVLSFDVKVWDPVNAVFVDIGDSTVAPGGPFSSTAPTLYDPTGTNPIGGNLNNTYPTASTYSLDTWHPAVQLGTVTTAVDPPFVPAAPTGAVVAGKQVGQTFQVTAIQITINYRDISSDQIRQLTIQQSLLDQVMSSGE